MRAAISSIGHVAVNKLISLQGVTEAPSPIATRILSFGIDEHGERYIPRHE